MVNVVNMRWSMLSVVAMSAACMRPAGPAEPKPSPAALATQPVEWAQRDPAAPLIPPSVKHLQIVITPGWSNDEHYAWLISEGTEVIALYHLTAKDLTEVISATTRLYAAASNGAVDRSSFVMIGSIHAPSPPPPGPPGMPPFYVGQVIQAAQGVNRAAAGLERSAAGE